MNKSHNRKEVLDLIIQTINNSNDKNTLISKLISLSRIDAIQIVNIVSGKLLPYEIPMNDLVIIYSILSDNNRRLQPVSYYFEEEEIDNAKRYAREIDREYIANQFRQNFSGRNPDRKTDFVYDNHKTEKLSSVNSVITKFRKYGYWENEFDKDMCDFNASEFESLFSDITNFSYYTHKSVISKYINWCVEKAYISDDQLDIVQSVSTDDISNSSAYERDYYKSPEELDRRVQEIENTLDERIPRLYVTYENYTNIILPSIWLAWIGFAANEIVKLKSSDAELINGSLVFNKKGITESDTSIVEKIRPSISNIGDRPLIRTKENEPCKREFLMYQVSLFNKRGEPLQGNKNIKLDKIRLSGIFYRLLQYEKEHNTKILRNQEDLIRQLCRDKSMNTIKVFSVYKAFELWKEHLANGR